MIGKYKVIDFHCHVYPEKIALKATAGTDTFYGVLSKHLGTPEDLLKSAEFVDRFVIHSVATTPAQVRKINEYLSSVVKENGRFIGFGTLHPESDDIEGDIDNLVSLGLKGVKMHPDIQRFKIDDYRCLKIYEICEKRHIPVLLHTGDKRYDYSNPDRLRTVCEIYKDLTVIGAHFGGYSMWEEASRELCGLKSLYVDCSSSLPWIDKETALGIIRRYGADKVLFGTDYPMHDPAEEAERFLSLGLSDDEYKKIFYDNAAHLLGIE